VAKKKEKVEAEENNTWSDKLLKDYGNIFMKASDVKEKKIRSIPIGPVLNLALGKNEDGQYGIPEAGMMLISGPEKSGKTTLALALIKSGMDLYNKNIFIFDCEGRFYNMHLNSVTGLDLDKITVIKSTKEKILAAHEMLEIAKHIIKTVDNSIILIDSTSSLVCESELTGEIKSSGRNETPKLLASFCRSIGQILPVQNTLCILIQHLITNTSGWGSPFMEDGGVSVKFQCSCKVRAKTFRKWVNNDVQIGQEVDWQIVHAPHQGPTDKVTSYIRYGKGIDDTMEILKLGIDLGIVSKGGSWLEFEGEKIQGEQKMYDFLEENPQVKEKIYSEIKSIV